MFICLELFKTLAATTQLIEARSRIRLPSITRVRDHPVAMRKLRQLHAEDNLLAFIYIVVSMANKSVRRSTLKSNLQTIQEVHDWMTAAFKVETDRGLVLICADLLDKGMRDILLSAMNDSGAATRLLGEDDAPSRGALSSFGSRLNACLALGLISEPVYREIVNIQKIRNKFAHSMAPLTLKDPDVATHARRIKTLTPSEETLQLEPGTDRLRFRLFRMTLGIYLLLFNRKQMIVPRTCVPTNLEFELMGNEERNSMMKHKAAVNPRRLSKVPYWTDTK